MLKQIQTVIRCLTEAAGSVVGLRCGTEEPRHSSEQLTDGVEIRHYGPRIAAETTVRAGEEAARNIGFRRLARYIFGANHATVKIAMTAPVVQHSAGASGEKIAMTAPVSQRAAADGVWVIRFFMPADKTMDSLPLPDDSEVTLVNVPPETVAVLRFSGIPTETAVASQTAKLLRTLREHGFASTGTPAAWFYDPPWTIPMLRRNEIAVPVTAIP
ncbi:heme-binding protein [Mycobacterium simiae]|uniref:Heme-binding protein n=1 Tax=Mycobacterium simiae TaxID=1784 RepID=A0A5B1BV77_MYCSI|nr:heme-binding protein [Mycobacterium simiae]KAA1251645.1 heme-binding protein [Mycobacterium simiae]